jgi:uncharacterized lipoprotein YajG
MVKKLVSVSMLAVALGLTAGCATTQSVDEVRAMAQSAQKAAADAQSTASAAMKSAQQANTCCSDTNAKIDRMFQKSMHK